MFIHQPLVYCHFAQGVGEPRYHQVRHIHTHTHTKACSQSCFRFGVHVAPFQASIYSLLIALVKWVSLIVSDLTQFSNRFICGGHTQRF